jgi:hypothetical protein
VLGVTPRVSLFEGRLRLATWAPLWTKEAKVKVLVMTKPRAELMAPRGDGGALTKELFNTPMHKDALYMRERGSEFKGDFCALRPHPLVKALVGSLNHTWGALEVRREPHISVETHLMAPVPIAHQASPRL